MTQQRDGPCFKHSVQWRSRVEWLTNKLRPRIEPVLRGRNLKPVQFVDAFRNLLCICGDLKQKHHLKQINDAVWGNVTEAALKDSVDALKSYTIDMGIKRFLDDLMKLLNQTQAISQQGYEYSMKCAYRVTFLVQKIITQHDFSMIHRYYGELQKREPKVVRFELEGLPLDKFDTIVAPGNTILKDFGLKHSCLVSLKKIGKPDGEWVVKAMIKKVVEDVALLEDVKAKLIQQLLVKEETKAPIENDNSASVVQTALDIQKTNTTQPFVPQTTSTDELNHTHIPADNNPERSQSGTLVNLSSQFGSQSTTGMVLNSNEERSQSENCLVHSQQWMSTYQFILNQCINHNMLSASRGYEFSEQICTCCNNTGQSDNSLYLMSVQELQGKLKKVRDELMSWRNSIIVMKKFIQELEKEETASTWHSLVKFVHHFIEIKDSSDNGASQ